MHQIPTIDEKKHAAQSWFAELRDQICARFVALEETYISSLPEIKKRTEDRTSESALSAPHCGVQQDEAGGNGKNEDRTSEPALSAPHCGVQEHEAGGNGNIQFTPSLWNRPEGGGGVMSLMKGEVFEKVGVNISTVHGEFSENFRKEIPHAEHDPRFWATGISLVAHMKNPHVPAVHMNTRMIISGDGESARIWFGGGGDLNPSHPKAEDTAFFHAAYKRACDATDASYYEKFRAWCEEYFWLKHRGCARGVGGIFYDYLDKDWQTHFAFTQSVGRAFLEAFPPLVEKHMFDSFTPEERHEQLVYRGRYAEFNLLYDRGTRFGLMTGGNTDAILMSLPPLAVWE